MGHGHKSLKWDNAAPMTSQHVLGTEIHALDATLHSLRLRQCAELGVVLLLRPASASVRARSAGEAGICWRAAAATSSPILGTARPEAASAVDPRDGPNRVEAIIDGAGGPRRADRRLVTRY
jgi:hypothetical protein